MVVKPSLLRPIGIGGFGTFTLATAVATALLGGTFGTIYVSTRTYLPLSYTVSTRPIATTGSFAVTYGGHFNIQAPHT